MSWASTEKVKKWISLLFVKVFLYDLSVCLLSVCEVSSLSTGSSECNLLLLFWDQDDSITVKKEGFISAVCSFVCHTVKKVTLFILEKAEGRP